MAARTTLPNTPAYWDLVRREAERLETDGCSGPASLTQWYIAACWEHDIHYRTGKDVFGQPICRLDSDDTFSWRIRQLGREGLTWHPTSWIHLGAFPMSAWRWLAVRVGGHSSYKGAICDCGGGERPYARDSEQAP